MPFDELDAPVVRMCSAKVPLPDAKHLRETFRRRGSVAAG